MADKNGNPVSRSNNSQTEEDMQILECPFTWNMDDITKDDDLEYQLDDDEELFPILKLMRQLMTVYVDTKSKIETDEILKGLEKCDEIMATLKENNHPEMSTDVANYILLSTKCFVFKHLNLGEKLKQVFSEIKYWSNKMKRWRMNKKERSTLMACRSICLSKYQRKGTREAKNFILDAIRENPNCDLWHFILGRNLRRKRRDLTIIAKPSKKEIESFKKAYSMSANPVFGVFLAQMYREMWKKKEAKYIYNQIFEQNPTGTTVLLKLALGFIQLNNYAKAKECLDKVETISPNHSMYLHYRGIYYFNRKNYKEAAKFLKEASKDNNIPAEKQYLDCAVMLDKSFDVVQYLHVMLFKYNNFPEEKTQPLILDLALTYWLKKQDVPSALKYFTAAVEIDPKATCLVNYYSSLAIPVTEKNMYKLLNETILPIVHKYKEKFEQSCIDKAEGLQRHCDKYFAKKFAITLETFSKINLRN